MQSAKFVKTPLGQHFKLSINQHSQTDEERKEMICITNANASGSLMYLLVRTRPNLTFVVSSV